MFVDGEWGSNYKIVEGDILHEKVDDPFANEKRKDIFYSRSVPVFSDRYGLYGVLDIIEFRRCDNGVGIKSREGLWAINPIEYKNGKPEKSDSDAFQLCAAALCLEEMFSTMIKAGEIYYGKLRRRVNIPITFELKERTKKIVSEIRELLDKPFIPPKPENQYCGLCSLSEICLPSIFDKKDTNKTRIGRMI